MRIEEIMNENMFTCSTDDTLHTAAKTMWDRDCGALAVVDQAGKLVGMLTDRDICMAAYTKGRVLSEILANEAMARTVHALRRDHTVTDAEELMANHQVRRIPVIDANGKPIGLVSLGDLAREAARSSSKIDGGMGKLVQTFASICQRRGHAQHAA